MSDRKIGKLAEHIISADAIVVGAGAGLSASAGMTYSGKRFTQYFADFIARYHFTDMYSGGFYPFPSPEEHWAYWSRYIWLNRYQSEPGPVYTDLLGLMKNKDYFIMTTNVDHCFQKAGFEKSRLFYTQGDYGLWQCSEPCHHKTYDNEDTVHRMVEEQKDMQVPSELVPYCPVCGRPMTMNLRCDQTFVQDKGWHEASRRYKNFLQEHDGQHILFLEFGVGSNTPGIIKYPFWQMTYKNEKAVYACVNWEAAIAPPEISGRSICIAKDIGQVLATIRERGCGK